MDQEQLQTFVDVIDAGSFSKAAEDKYISKQAMLKQIERLENEVGAVLLIRSKRGVKPTSAGSEFYSGAKKLLHDQQALIIKCRRRQPNEILRIGSVEHQVLLNRVVEEFSKKYPDVQIQKVIHPNHSGEWRVENNLMDVGETFVGDEPEHRKLSYTKLTEVPYVAAMRRNHPCAKKKTISLQEMAEYTTYVYPRMVKHQYILEIQKAFQKNKKKLIQRNDVDNQVAAAYECVGSDTILITANPFIYSIDGLKTVPLSTGWQREYGIIYKAPVSAAVQKFIDLAVLLYTE